MLLEKTKTLTFQTLLEFTGIDAKDVILFRHAELSKGENSPCKLWHREFCENEEDRKYTLYNSLQGKPIDRRYIASFVALPTRQTLFTGIFEVTGEKELPEGLRCPVSNNLIDKTTCFNEVKLTNHLSDMIGKLYIEWGNANVVWEQKADNHSPKRIKCISEEIWTDGKFPGFGNFIKNLSELENIPSSWREILSATQGIYLLTCVDTGKQYVGSASGKDGFYQRWMQYIEKDGGNLGLKKHTSHNFQVSILERYDMDGNLDDNKETIEKREARWKDKFLSRKFGLNEI